MRPPERRRSTRRRSARRSRWTEEKTLRLLWIAIIVALAVRLVDAQVAAHHTHHPPSAGVSWRR